MAKKSFTILIKIGKARKFSVMIRRCWCIKCTLQSHLLKHEKRHPNVLGCLFLTNLIMYIKRQLH